jgi:hypothetical protein
MSGGLAFTGFEGVDTPSDLSGALDWPALGSMMGILSSLLCLWGPLFSDGARLRLLRQITRPHRQVLAHHIDNHARNHKQNGDPDTPITVRTFPVWTMVLLNALALQPSKYVVTLLTFVHWFPVFSLPSRMFSGDHSPDNEVGVCPAAEEQVDQLPMLSCLCPSGAVT